MATTTVQLINGAEIQLSVDPQTLIDAWKSALVSNGLIKLHGDDGRAVNLNPHLVLSVSEGTPAPVSSPNGSSGLAAPVAPTAAGARRD